jgi:hypothetical protein
LDSGGGFSTFTQIENLICLLKEKLQVEIRNADIPYEEFEIYLLRHSEEFSSSIDRETDIFNFLNYDGPYLILRRSNNQFARFKERFHNKEYPEALRDLRAMVQQAEENLVKEKGLDFSGIQELDINKLAALLIDKKIIDGRLRGSAHLLL